MGYVLVQLRQGVAASVYMWGRMGKELWPHVRGTLCIDLYAWVWFCYDTSRAAVGVLRRYVGRYWPRQFVVSLGAGPIYGSQRISSDTYAGIGCHRRNTDILLHRVAAFACGVVREQVSECE